MDLGVFLDFPHRKGISEALAFTESLRYARLVEDLGLDSVWLAELHFYPGMSLISSPLIIASACAARTNRIRIGTAVEVLPLGNPIRIAEEVATIDHISQGRFDFGVGRSSAVRGYAGYNIPYSESSARFWECLEVIQKAWTQEPFSYSGEFYSYDDVCLTPRPFQKPYPPIRVAANSLDTFPIAARKGLSLFVGLRGVPSALRERVDLYRSTWAEARIEGNPDVCLRVPVYVAETMEKARSDPEQSALNFYRNFVATIFNEPVPGLSDEENAERAARGRRLASITYDEILKTDTAFGTPDAVAERLMELKETLGLDSIAAEINFGGLLGPEQVERSLRLFAEEVAPKLR